MKETNRKANGEVEVVQRIDQYLGKKNVLVLHDNSYRCVVVYNPLCDFYSKSCSAIRPNNY